MKKKGFTVASKKTEYVDMDGNTIEEPGGSTNGDVSINYVDPKYYSLTIWSTYYDRSPSKWSIYTSLNRSLTATEPYPASFDALSVNWQKDVFRYEKLVY